MRLFQILLTLIWLTVVYVTVVVTKHHGIALSVDTFSKDLSAMDWRTQYDVDLLAHMFLIGTWTAWRHGFKPVGILAGLFVGLNGSLVSFVYILVLSVINKGDMKKILLGVHAKTAG